MLRSRLYALLGAAFIGSLAAESGAVVNDMRFQDANTIGDMLFPSARLFDASCNRHVTMKEDGNLVLYDDWSENVPIWASNTSNRTYYTQQCVRVDPVCALNCDSLKYPNCGVCGGKCSINEQVVTSRELFKYFIMQGDGNAVLGNYVVNGQGNYLNITAAWSTATNGHAGAWFTVESYGNALVRNDAGNVFWSTNTGGRTPINWCPGAGYASNVMRVYQNMDHVGGDFDYTTQQTWQVCANRCVHNASCKAFTFSNATKGCWLKSIVPSRSAASGYMTGKIRT